MKYIILFIIFIFTLYGCGIETGGGGYRTNDKEYTRLLYQELNNLSVVYTVDNEGFIRYEEQEKKKFEKAQKQVEHILYDGISTKPTDIEDQEYLIGLLKKNKLEYYLLENDDGIWVKWYPRDEAHRQKIMLQVVEHNFAKQINNLSDCNNPCNEKTSNK